VTAALRIADYDPDWPRQAAAAIDALRSAAPGLFLEIERIGSTAVPGLAAKPVIDLMAAVRDLSRTPAHDAPLAGLGFRPHPHPARRDTGQLARPESAEEGVSGLSPRSPRPPASRAVP
jgi:GrpB-like predicted nucleotidyltransferase (UPF0157 family)